VLVLLYEAQGRTIDTRLIVFLGILVAFNSALRFIEVAIPGPGVFQPDLFLIISPVTLSVQILAFSWER
jgi:energy-coupling factor transport system substrate-specific component